MEAPDVAGETARTGLKQRLCRSWVFSEKKAASGHPVAEKRIRCPLKGCRFTTKTNIRLEAHTQRKHSGNPKKGMFLCDVPGCKYAGTFVRSMFKRHQLVHQPAKVIPCLEEGCDYKTDRPDNLSYHIQRYHTNPVEATFACKEPGCEYIGGNKSDLRRHTYIHTGERPFHCDLCDYRAYQKSKVVRHKQQKHRVECTVESIPGPIMTAKHEAAGVVPEPRKKPGRASNMAAEQQLNLLKGLNSQLRANSTKLLECEDCEHVFKTAKLLANHRQSHTEKGYECCNCGYFSKCACCMLRHRKKRSHHQVEELWVTDKETPVDRLAAAFSGMACSCEDDLSGSDEDQSTNTDHYEAALDDVGVQLEVDVYNDRLIW